MPLRLHHSAFQHWGKASFILFLFCLLYWLSSFTSSLDIGRLSHVWSVPPWQWSSSKGSSRAYLQVNRPTRKHPIQDLVEQANLRFKKQLESQSGSLAQSIREYQRRYRRDPPPGFELWYNTAVENDCAIIDDYDTITGALEPFWALSAREVRDRVQAVVDSKNWLDIYTVKQEALVGPVGKDPIAMWINSFARHLPDLQIPYNHLAESRVVVPFEEQQSSRDVCPQRRIPRKHEAGPIFSDLSHESIWHHAIMSCRPQSQARISEGRLTEMLRKTNITRPEQLRFVNDVPAARDLCIDPELRYRHGNLISPDTTLLAKKLMPVFSRDKLSSFHDILVPTPAYARQSQGLESAKHVPWGEKQNDLYWTGTTTGGYSHNGSWRFSQRFRFVSLMNDPDRPVSFLQFAGGKWNMREGTIKAIGDTVNAKFTKQKLCTEKDCEAQRADSTIRFGDRDGPTEYRQHRLVMDVDGQASTNRFYKLLASGSTVIKQTLMCEWHDERLVPWVHYVPVSMELGEIAEVVRYLTQDEEGQRIARKIAEQGRKWWRKVLRVEDMRLYMFRLMLEWARIIDNSRDANRTVGCRGGHEPT